MSAAGEKVRPATWTQRFTLADGWAIDALSEDLRAIVERYVRHRGGREDGEPESIASQEYRDGFEDGLDEARSAISSCAPPRRMRRRGNR